MTSTEIQELCEESVKTRNRPLDIVEQKATSLMKTIDDDDQTLLKLFTHLPPDHLQPNTARCRFCSFILARLGKLGSIKCSDFQEWNNLYAQK